MDRLKDERYNALCTEIAYLLGVSVKEVKECLERIKERV
jgi:hypothetical protein